MGRVLQDVLAITKVSKEEGRTGLKDRAGESWEGPHLVLTQERVLR